MKNKLIKVLENKDSLGQRAADTMARFGGSWLFIILFSIGLSIWIAYNFLVKNPFDPYPFVFLNLMLSCLAAMQAPVIMMSNNRQGELDRIKQDKDLETDLANSKKLDEILKLLKEKE